MPSLYGLWLYQGVLRSGLKPPMSATAEEPVAAPALARAGTTAGRLRDGFSQERRHAAALAASATAFYLHSGVGETYFSLLAVNRPLLRSASSSRAPSPAPAAPAPLPPRALRSPRTVTPATAQQLTPTPPLLPLLRSDARARAMAELLADTAEVEARAAANPPPRAFSRRAAAAAAAAIDALPHASPRP